MTLLASERSLLIRNKFRSVLQLRIQNRRQQNEINADSGSKSSCLPKPGEKEQSEGVLQRQTDDGANQKLPPSGHTAESAPERTAGGALRHKKVRLVENLGEKLPHRPRPLELLHKNILPLENSSVTFPLASDVFEDDISCSSSSSPDQLGMHQSPSTSSSPGLAGDQSLSDLSPVSTSPNHSPKSIQSSLALLPATESISQPVTMTVAESNSMATTGRSKGMYMTTQTTPLLPKTAQHTSSPSDVALGSSVTSSQLPRPRKLRDSKPKMRKLKYHQYIPPDQRGGAGGGSGNASSQKNPTSSNPTDPAYSRLLQQQQVFLQLQILNQQQQLTVATSGDKQLVRFTGATTQSCPQSVPTAPNPTPPETSPIQKPELLPPNLDDLTVSELRKQLRKRGLHVSGTKPALLERLRPFQLPRPCLTPTPLCQLGATLDPHPTSLPVKPTTDPPTNPGHKYIPASGVARDKPNMSFLNPSTPPSGSSPGLLASSPLSAGTPWRSEQAAEELSVELEMRERIRSRPRDRRHETGSECGGLSLHPFLQQDPGFAQGKEDGADGQDTQVFTQVFCCQPRDMIVQDFELPMQITASPVQAQPGARSLEEELQEAIQRVQMDPNQSIEDILEETIACTDKISSEPETQSTATVSSSCSPSPQTDQSQPSQHAAKEEEFLSSPLCSSLLLELPPSPSTSVPMTPVPPPPPICTTPPPITRSRKRRHIATIDPAEWLESLTSGFQPLTPPAAPFFETDFGLDSDLNVNRVLDLMIAQW
ncbi:myocardin [Denticeps clupeoides]|uniref:SAP domain-containing protein n=1 Tax=Denticeps clupeoides TaxID=299321 RepID=A0AAY4A8N7_9TELE|nr:myocardin-like [Denticeps clupeoides]